MNFYEHSEIKRKEVSSVGLREVLSGGSVTVKRMEARKGDRSFLHTRNTEVVLYVVKGSVTLHMPTGDLTLRDDQMFHIPTGIEYSFEALEDTLALDICSENRPGWLEGLDNFLQPDPEQFLWAV